MNMKLLKNCFYLILSMIYFPAFSTIVQAGPVADGRYFIVSRHSDMAMDVEGISLDKGANIYQWPIHGGTNQQFDIEDVGGNFYTITSVHSGLRLDIAGISNNDGANLQQWTAHNGNNQQFHLRTTGDGHYGIIARHSNKALDIADFSQEQGGNIYQWEWTGNNNQQWRFEPVGSGPSPTEPPQPQPEAQFTSANNFIEGSAFQVVVVPTPLEGVESIELFVNGQSLRIERVTPYQWGGTQAADASLRSLPTGQHQLRALVSYEDGTSVQATQLLTLSPASTPIPEPTEPPLPTVEPTPAPMPPVFTSSNTIDAGEDALIRVEPQPLEDVSNVVLFLNNQTVRTENYPPYTWGEPGQPDNVLKNMSAGSYQLRAEVTYSNGTKTNATQTLTVRANDNNAWSNPATWGGQVPTGGNVRIEAGQEVVLDMNVTLNMLTIDGSLICADKDLRLNARVIMVHGHFICGTEANPYTKRAVITLTGNDRNHNIMQMGTKLIGAMGNGRIDIHGETRTSWTRLDKTANPGDNTIRLSEAPNWRVGDRIVIVSTSESVNENEERTITAISGRNVTLNQNLNFRHFGERQTFSNANRVWDVETRAEVALLSRNILIQGDAQSQDANPTHGFGGHMMIMEGSEAYISGVEMFRMGQTGILGRYPFHWHLAGDVTGQYIKNSSIHQSYNRCVTVHGTHNALVQDNVCFKHLGHGYFLEDGYEIGNVFDRNIAIRTFRPEANVALIPSDTMARPGNGHSAVGPAGFWISHPNNTFTNNVAVASDGLGFWFDTKTSVAQPSRDAFPESQSVNPKTSTLGVFDDNLVHSSMMGLSLCNGPGGHSGYEARRQTPAVYNRFTAYNAGDGGIWPCKVYHVFNDFRILDTGRPGGKRLASFVSPNAMTVQNSLFVANSKLTVPAKPRVAIGMYDQGVYFKNVHFENYTFGDQSSIFQAQGGAEQFASTRVENATFKNSPYIYRGLPASFSNLNSIVHDVDGSFGFGADSVLVPTQANRGNSRIYTTSDCEQIPNNNGIYVCPGSFASMDVWVYDNGRALKDETLTVRNSEGVQFTGGHGPAGVIPWVSTLVPINAQNTNRELTYIFPADTWSKANEIRFDIVRGKPGPNQIAYFKVPNVPGSVRFKGNTMQKANSVNDVKNTANSWYRDGSTLHVAIKLNGNDWAETKADIRMEW